MNIKSKILNCKKKVSGLVGKVITGVSILGLLTGSVKAGDHYNVEGFALKSDYSLAAGDTATAHIDTRPGEVLQDIVNVDGLYTFDLGDFPTSWNIGEKLIVNVKDGSRKTKTQIDSIPGPSGGIYNLPDQVVTDATSKKRMINLYNLIDTSNTSGNIYAVATPWKTSVPCTALVDTGVNQGWEFWDDVHVITPLAHGDTFDFKIVEEGTSGITSRDSLVYDSTKFIDAFVMTPERYDTIYFPEEVIDTDTTPPEISNATEWQDTTHKGPFEVSYDRIDGSGILSDSLIYKVNQGTSKTVPADSVVGDKAYCTIDTIVAPDDSIHYKVKSIDASANTNVAYWPASGWHSFKVNSIGTEESQPAEKSFRISPNPFYSNVSISYPIEKAELNIYDVSGRLVDEVQVNDYKAEWGKDASKGVYFVKPKDGTLNGKIEVKNKSWKLIKL